MSEPAVVLVQYAAENGGEDIIFLGAACTDAQFDELEEFVRAHVDEDLGPWVGRVTPEPFDQLMAHLRELWGEEEDAPTVPAGG